MNELMRVAGEYFNRMEGRHLYPGWRTRHWYMVLLSSAAFIGFAWYGFVRLNDHQVSGMLLVPLLAAEFGIIWATDGVTRYRRKKLTGADIKHQAKANEQIDPLRIAALEELLMVPRSQFLRIAKDAQELIKLNKDYRLSTERGFADFLEVVSSTESRGRVWAVTLALISLIATLVVREAPADFDFVALMLEDGAKSILLLLALTVFCFGIYIAVSTMISVVMQGMRMWLAKLRGQHQSNFALRYFMRDLIRLHSVVQEEQPATPRIAEDESSNERSFDPSNTGEPEDSFQSESR